MNKIYPIETGRFLQMQKTNFTYTRNQGDIIQASVLMFLIETPTRLIAVDTGGSGEAWAREHHHPLVRTEDMVPDRAVEKLGFSPKDVSVIVNTHLHWDHATNNDLFPNAEIYVQKKEVEYALDPLPIHYTYYESPAIGLTPPWFSSLNRMKLIWGDLDLGEGIKLLHLPGHTPGFQGVAVETAEGEVLLAGDCLPLYENWQAYGPLKYLPSGIHGDLFEYYKTLERIESMNVRIIPGHDTQVSEITCIG